MARFFKRFGGWVVAAILLLSNVAVSATYTQTLLADGTNLWYLLSSNASAVSQMSLKNGASVVVTFDPTAGVMLTSSLVAALPTCATALTGAIRVVTDGNSTTTGGTLAGSGSYTVLGICNGTNWIVN